jgi:hypothetical protein
LCFEIPFIIMQDLLQGDVIVSDAWKSSGIICSQLKKEWYVFFHILFDFNCWFMYIPP